MLLPSLFLLLNAAVVQDTVTRPDTEAARRAAMESAAGAAARDDSLRRAARRARSRPSVAPPPAADAYRDETAREMVARARAARTTQDSSLRSYDATTVQRASAGIGFRKVGRDRLAFRSENAARVRWERGVGAHVDVLGSRAALPMVFSGARVIKDFMHMTTIPYFPGREGLIGFREVVSVSSQGQTAPEDPDDESDEMFANPLGPGAEGNYRYESGDSIRYTLADGSRLLLREVRVRARAPRSDLVVGSLWFDVASGQLVRAAYRPSQTVDIKQFVEQEDSTSFEDVPTFVKPLIFPMRMDVTGMTVEYGLHEQRWWLPRSQNIEGMVRVGFMRVPFSMEESFRYTSVNGIDSLPPIALSPNDSARAAEAELRRAGNERAADSLRALRYAEHDSMRVARRKAQRDSARQHGGSGRDDDDDDDDLRGLSCPKQDTLSQSDLRYEGTLRVAIRIPCDTAALAHSPLLPPSIFDSGDEQFGRADRDELMKSLTLSLQPEFGNGTTSLHYGLDRAMIRYNRIEALSVGGEVEHDFGAGYVGAVSGRVGVGDWQPNGELSFRRSNGRRTFGVGMYKRLAVVDDWGTPLSVGSSLATLFMARDEAFYFRSWGGELTGTFGTERPLTVRLFAEHQWPASVETQFSIPHVISGVQFVDNIVAERGNVAGIQLRHVASYGLDPQGWRGGTDVRLEGGVWDFTYLRGAVDGTLSHGLGRWLVGSVTAGAGTSAGTVPTQRLWYIGGGHTVRGMLPGEQSGDAFWMARAELGGNVPYARPIIFSDLGWAGSRSDWLHQGQLLNSVGVGVSMLDGLLRFDLAKAIDPSHGLRMYVTVETNF